MWKRPIWKKNVTKLIARQCQALCISQFQVPPVNSGAFARVVSPGSGGRHILLGPRVGYLPTPGPPPSLCASLSKYNDTWRILLETQADSKIGSLCQRREKLQEFFFLENVFSILWLHFFIAYQTRCREVSTWIDALCFGYGMKFLLI